MDSTKSSGRPLYAGSPEEAADKLFPAGLIAVYSLLFGPVAGTVLAIMNLKIFGKSDRATKYTIGVISYACCLVVLALVVTKSAAFATSGAAVLLIVATQIVVALHLFRSQNRLLDQATIDPNVSLRKIALGFAYSVIANCVLFAFLIAPEGLALR